MTAGAEPARPAEGRASLVPVLACVASGGALLAAFALERGNGAATLNFRQPIDLLVVAVMFSAGPLGAVVLLLRPRHVTGVLMLGSALCWGAALLAHALAVRLLLVHPPAAGSVGEAVGTAAAWTAGFAVVPAFGLLVFVPVTWPAGWPSGPRRRLTAAAAAALFLLTLAQALAPGPLEGVTGDAIDNPLGVGVLAGPVAVATSAAVAVLVAFAVVTLADLVRRGVRARGSDRSPYRPVLVALATAVVAALVVLPWRGGFPGAVAGVAVAVVGVGLAVGAGAATLRRVEQAERARARLVAEREVERARLRRELHDGLGPLLAALRLEVDGMAASGAEPGRARTLLADALAEVRRLSRDLRPVALDELGLPGALRHQAASLSRPGGPVISVALPEELPALAPAVEVAVMRICGEALTNVVRHAHAGTCALRLDVGADVRLEIRDDGVGLPSPVPAGVGLRSMVLRAEELGGSCELRSPPGGGAVLTARLPRQR